MNSPACAAFCVGPVDDGFADAGAASTGFERSESVELERVAIGEQYTYYPPKESGDDNRHFPATVEAVAKLVLVRIFMDCAPDGVLRRVSAKRLAIQESLL